MVSVTFHGESIEDVAAKARQLADTILTEWTAGAPAPELHAEPDLQEAHDGESVDEIALRIRRERREEMWGYRPGGVGRPRFAPVDDGSEWGTAALEDWIRSFTYEGEVVIGVLANEQIIDPRHAFRQLGWLPNKWSGTWTGPRKQAKRVMEDRGLHSWPYGHSYDEPRRLWMHPGIGARALGILEKLRQERT